MNTRMSSVRRSREDLPQLLPADRQRLGHAAAPARPSRRRRGRRLRATAGPRRSPSTRSAAARERGFDVGGRHRPAIAARRARPCRTGSSSRPPAWRRARASPRPASSARTSTIGAVRRRPLDLGRRADRREPPGVDQRDAMAALRLVQVVRGDEHGDARLRQRVDQPPELPARQRVDAAGRLVEEENRRLVEDRAAERQALAPAARQIARERLLRGRAGRPSR